MKIPPTRHFTRGVALFLLSNWLLSAMAVEPDPGAASAPTLTSLGQLCHIVAAQRRVVCNFRLEATVCAVDSKKATCVLQDASGAAPVEMDWQKKFPVPGQSVIVEGKDCAVSRSGVGVAINRGPVVDNYGVHEKIERSGAVFLDRGLHPLRLAWFHRDGPPALDVSCQSSKLPRQDIPGPLLFHAAGNSAGPYARPLPGLTFKAYEGRWSVLPNFDQLKPVRTGTVRDFDLSGRTQDEYIGIQFDGLLSVTEAGIYTFYLASDDGSQLFVAEPPPGIELLELKPPPAPQPVAIGQAMSPGTGPAWSTLAGTVTFVGRQSGDKWELEMSAGTDRLRVLVADGGNLQPPLLLGSKVEMAGICEPARTTAGQITPGLFWVLQTTDIKILEVASELWTAHPATPISNVLRRDFTGPVDFVHVRGRVYWDKSGASAWMEDETGELYLSGAARLPKVGDGLMDVIGARVQLGTNIVLQPAGWKDVADATITDGTLPVLTTAMEIRQLKREEAQRHYPVKICGVITSILPQYQSVIVQDDTRGICVTNLTPELCDQPQIGDDWEVEGVTSASTFAPKVAARRVTRLGGAQPLPTPVMPTWDQLMNGSLDAQYVEIRGVVTAVNDEALTLLTPNGRVEVFLTGKSRNELEPFENTLVRIRGALFAEWDGQTHQVQRAQIRFFTVSLNVDQAAPADPFDVPEKRAAEIRLFDASASATQRIQVFGQIICARKNEFFLLDRNSGLRFTVNAPIRLAPGDLVKVSGFPDLTGSFPMLRDTVVRKTGNGPLPPPNRLGNNAVAESDHDATWVQIEATLLALRRDGPDQILELQNGIRTFIARLATREISVRQLLPGSRLRLTGVYADQGPVQLAAGPAESFELLLNSSADIKVLGRPPWWSLKQLMVMVGFLLIGLTAALIWITQLRRQVEKRSRQLQHEIRERHRVEHQRALAEERSRIARDLHDDLGTSLTEISLLAEAAFGAPQTLEKGRDRFRKIGDKTRSVVEALDVMVWLVNPRSDALPFIAGYLGSYAEECLGAAAITCRLKMPVNLPDVLLTSEIRHNLFLAFKEPLHNVVRHAHASEVVVELSVLDGELKLAVKDNGCGFDPEAVKAGNGLANLSDRLVAIGGRSGIASRPGAGAVITFTLPLPAPAAAGTIVP